MSNEQKPVFSVRYSTGGAGWGSGKFPPGSGMPLGSFPSVKAAKASAESDAATLPAAKGMARPILEWEADEHGNLCAEFGGGIYTIEAEPRA